MPWRNSIAVWGESKRLEFLPARRLWAFFSRLADTGMVLSMNETEQETAAVERRARLRALYARAFEEYGTRALWNMRRFEEPELGDVVATTRQLCIEGNLAARRVAEQIEMPIRAGH